MSNGRPRKPGNKGGGGGRGHAKPGTGKSRKQQERKPDRGKLTVNATTRPKQRFKKPPLRIQTTTLWEYPSQHYGDELQGDKNYAGATPSWVIWQLLQRYTDEGDVVVDPMCGSGTTIDVCRDTGRTPAGFDLAPVRDDVTQADARDLPVSDNTARLAFVDPPYSTHIDYSDNPDCIGKLDALDADDGGAAYYEAMAGVLSELTRVLKPGGVLAVYVSDSFKKRRGASRDNPGTFAPIGFALWSMMMEVLEPVDIIAVVRHNEKLTRGNWHKAAEEHNFYLRGFNYLLIARKPKAAPKPKSKSKPKSKGGAGRQRRPR